VRLIPTTFDSRIRFVFDALPNGPGFSRRAGAGWSFRRKLNLKAAWSRRFARAERGRLQPVVGRLISVLAICPIQDSL